MKIFQNAELKADEMDYTQWETVNGDFIKICDMRTEYLERCIETLENYVNNYPHHKNSIIWEKYLDEMEEELAVRQD